ncbi:restriction endonuclease subunit S [Faecalibacterium prausnitzii]|uniref:restriction endonuclease subunit S n=1 Tax=Faecalibacterium prausnitzii TaxID=853 RepID=UPI000DE508F1|nr:restriction endonuclease subunit S [Faecalibacterium prausnitzii]AXB29141.1 restriction endonuclease subunit S [Faecalibacterium prausnitzii]
MKSEWKTIRAADFMEFNPRMNLKKGTIATKISMDKLQPYTKKIPETEQAEFSGGTKFSNSDTIMARITPCLENGKTAFVDCLNKDEVAFGSTEFIVLRAKPGVSDAQFVYYLATSPEFRQVAIKSMVGSSGRQRVQQPVLENLELVVPELPKQKRIGGFLAAIDDKIALNAKINDNLEQQAATYFQELFINNANPVWQISTISDLGTVVGGSTPSKTKPEYYTNNGIAWITPKDLSINKSKFISHGENDITELGLKNSSATVMPKGTVLFSSRAPIGYIAIASNEVTTNQGFKSVIPYSEIGTAFVYFFLKHSLPVIESAASGSTFKEISGSAMKNIPAIIPDRNTLDQFNSFCAPIFAQQKILEEQNHSLAMLRDSLLPKLMSGAIDIASIQL